jgi:CrcB protein
VLLIGIGIGGFCGAVARYYLGAQVTARWNNKFPLGTYLINITGAFILCFLLGLSHQGQVLSPVLNAVIATGFLVAFTTFSTYSLESVQLFEKGRWVTALSYFCCTIFSGLLTGWLGYLVGITI